MLKYIFLSLFTVLFIACDDDFETPNVTEPVQGTAPVLNALTKEIDLVLEKRNEKDTILDLMWTDATYADPIGVRYYVQVDTVGNEFKAPLEFDRVNAITTTIKVGDLNTLISSRYTPAKKVELEARIRAFANEDLNNLFSSSISIKVTPYLDVPIPTELYIYGSATPTVKVTEALMAYDKDNIFTKYLKLTKDGLFKFSDKQADDAYDYNFAKFATRSENIVAAGDDAVNFKFTGETGWYKVEADFVQSKLTIEKKLEGSTTYTAKPDALYLVGNYNTTDPEWAPTTAPIFTKTSEGVFTIDKVLKDGAEFKFIGQQSWGDLDWANIKGKGNSSIIAPKGDNDNITFDGADNLHTITVNLNTGIFTIVKKELPDLFLVGATSANGWNEGNRVAMYRDGTSRVVYTYLKGKVSDDDQFRFIDGNTGWNGNFGIHYFSSVPSTITAVPGNGDGNMFFTGETGIYKITVTIDKELQIEKASLGFDYDNMYLVGNINGWDAGNAIAMTKGTEGVFTHEMQLSDGAEFKFIGQQAWGDLDWGNIFGKGNSGFVAPKGSNDNITFNGGDKTYVITLNLKVGTFTIIEK